MLLPSIFFLTIGGSLGHVLYPGNIHYPQFAHPPAVWHPINQPAASKGIPICRETTTPEPETTTESSSQSPGQIPTTPVPVVPINGVLDPGGNSDTPARGFSGPAGEVGPPSRPEISAPPVYISVFLSRNGGYEAVNPKDTPINITLVYNYIVNRQEFPKPELITPPPCN